LESTVLMTWKMLGNAIGLCTNHMLRQLTWGGNWQQVRQGKSLHGNDLENVRLYSLRERKNKPL
jgi:hypothetical protein